MTAIIANKPGSPAAVGGVVGGLLGIGLIVALIAFLVLRSKQGSRSQNPDSTLQSPNKEISLDTAAPLGHPSKTNVKLIPSLSSS